MTDDDGILRARLARLDPARQAEASAPTTSPTAQEIRERVMQTIEETKTLAEGSPRWRRPAAALSAAAAVVAIAAGAVVLARGDDAPRQAPVPTTMALSAPAGADGPTMSSCIMFDVAILREMPVAFGGTVVDVAPNQVTLDVDRWYKGGSADQVTVTNMDAQTVALDGVEFTKGSRYLVTATGGTVNVCGFSGPATPDLEKAFAEAFPG